MALSPASLRRRKEHGASARDLLEVADRAYVMENGSIRFTGLPDDLLRSDELRRAYLGL